MGYLLLSIIIISLVGILMVPNAFAVKEITVQNAPGSSVSGCEKTDRCFIPSTAKINPGDTVVWTNPDTMYHIVASGTTADGSDGIFDSGLILAGQTFSYKFNKSGTYDYFCLSHPWMEGTVVVGGGTSSPNSPSKTSTTLTLDVDSTFKTQAGSDYAIVTFSGVLESSDVYITNAEIKLVFKGLTFGGKDHYEVKTDVGGKFSEKLRIPVGKNYSVYAAFAGGALKSSGEVVAPSKSQTHLFMVTLSSSSQPSTSSVGGPTFLKLEIETDKRDVTVSGKLTDKATKKYVVRDTVITLIPSNFAFSAQYNMPPCKVSGFPNCELTTDSLGNFDVDFRLNEASIGKKFSIQAVFHGNNQWDPSKSLTQSFTVTSSSSSSSTSSSTSTSSQPQTSTSSGDFGWIWPLIIGGVVCAVVAVVLAKKNKKKKPKATPQRKTSGVKQPKKRRTAGSPVGVPSSSDGPSTYGYFECPKCHEPSAPQGKLGQNPDGSQFCSVCGWTSED